jgi:hypothetical protein
MSTPTYTPLATVTLGGTATSVTFSSIPATYRDLILIVSGLTTTTTVDALAIRFNSDTGSNYSNVQMTGDGSSATSASSTNTAAFIGLIGDGAISVNVISVMDYSATDKHKTVIGRGNVPNSRTRATASRWADTAAITSALVRTNADLTFTAGSTFSLYGVIA